MSILPSVIVGAFLVTAPGPSPVSPLTVYPVSSERDSGKPSSRNSVSSERDSGKPSSRNSVSSERDSGKPSSEGLVESAVGAALAYKHCHRGKECCGCPALLARAERYVPIIVRECKREGLTDLECLSLVVNVTGECNMGECIERPHTRNEPTKGWFQITYGNLRWTSNAALCVRDLSKSDSSEEYTEDSVTSYLPHAVRCAISRISRLRSRVKYACSKEAMRGRSSWGVAQAAFGNGRFEGCYTGHRKLVSVIDLRTGKQVFLRKPVYTRRRRAKVSGYYSFARKFLRSLNHAK